MSRGLDSNKHYC